MAGFKCDICGGDIKMQANKTGVCQGCGMEYDLEAIRAMVGQQSAPTAPVQSAPAAPVAQTQDELDRESLLVYLNDVRLLETAINNSEIESKKLSVCEEINNENTNNLIAEQDKIKNILKNTESNVITKESPGNPTIIAGIVILIIGVIILFHAIISDSEWAIFTVLIPIFGGLIICSGIHLNKNCEDERITLQHKQNVDITKLNERIDSFEKQIASSKQFENKEKAEIEELRFGIDNEVSEIRCLLEKAFSANIIPQQFRNIEGVYYLYDYLSTSNQSLSEALMQANLEAIKQKLDDMIRLQSAQIVQQAQTNAKLDNIQAQNERLVQLSEATMNNTAVAAKYAQIAAVNSELNAKLAAESLAYQKAAFWLK